MPELSITHPSPSRRAFSTIVALTCMLGPLAFDARADVSPAGNRKLATIEKQMQAVPITGDEPAPFDASDSPSAVYKKMGKYTNALRITRQTLPYIPAPDKSSPRYAAVSAYYKRLSAKVAQWEQLSSKMSSDRSKARMAKHQAKQQARTDARNAGAKARRLEGSHKPAPDDGIVNDTHRAFVNKIVFSRKPIVLATAKPAQFTDAYTLETKIFFRTYLDKSLKNVFLSRGFACRAGGSGGARRYYFLHVDGAPFDGKEGILFVHGVSGDAYTKWTSFRFDDPLNGKLDPKEASIHRSFVEKVVPRLTAGTHKLTLSLGGDCYGEHIDGGYKRAYFKDFASGDFTLTIGKRDLKAFLAKHGPKMPRPGMRNPRLTRAMKTILADKWRNEKVLAIVISSRNWDVRRNKYTGIILRRLVSAQAFVKRKDTGICRVFDVLYEQKHLGRNRYGTTMWGGVGSSREFPCASIR